MSVADITRTAEWAALKRHRQALALHDNYARRGDVPQLRGVAAAAVPVVRGHLDHIQRM